MIYSKTHNNNHITQNKTHTEELYNRLLSFHLLTKPLTKSIHMLRVFGSISNDLAKQRYVTCIYLRETNCNADYSQTIV